MAIAEKIEINETFPLLGEVTITTTDNGGFIASWRQGGAYNSYACGGDLGSGISMRLTRFETLTEAIYCLRAESLRRQLARAIQDAECAEEARAVTHAELLAIPLWIRRIFAPKHVDDEGNEDE